MDLESKMKAIADALKNHWHSKPLKGFQSDLVTLKGLEKTGGKPVKALYIGNSSHFSFLTNRLFSDFEICDTERNVHAVSWCKLLFDSPENVDLIMCEFPALLYPFFKKKGFLFIPNWIEQYVDLNSSWDEVSQRFRKNIKKKLYRRIKNFDLSCKFSKQMDDFELFYSSMYEPFTKKRYGDSAVIIEKERLRNQSDTEMLHILSGDRVILMALIKYDSGTKYFSLLKLGVPEGLDRNTFTAANTGFYYFAIREAHRRGCRRIGLGKSRAMLNDGVFQFKRKWNAQIGNPAFLQWSLVLKPTHLSGGVYDFFVNNSFIVSDGNRFSAKLLIDEENVRDNYIRTIFENNYSPGLHRLKIFSRRGIDAGKLTFEQEIQEKICLVDLSRSLEPAKDFCEL